MSKFSAVSFFRRLFPAVVLVFERAFRAVFIQVGIAMLPGFSSDFLYDLALEQIGLIENSRKHYVSFESKYTAALMKSSIMKKTGKALLAKEQFETFLSKAERLGAYHLLQLDKSI